MGLLRKIIEIHYEQAQAKKALRLLSKQNWSVDFLTALVVKASKVSGPVEMIIKSPSGATLIIKPTSEVNKSLQDDDDILNKLDDQAAVNAFITKHAV